MRSGFVIFLIAATITAALAETNDWSKRIVSKRLFRPFASMVHPHEDDIKLLIVDGKHFKGVRGEKPFYLAVPGMDAIVFVVDEKDFSQTFHIFKMVNDVDIVIRLQNFSSFGLGIGVPNYPDTVQNESDGKIILSRFDQARSGESRSTNIVSMKEMYYLDLNKGVITTHKRIYCDKTGKVIHELDSKPPY